MNIKIRFNQLDVSDFLKDYAQNRVRERLRHFVKSLSTVTVTFADVNGPRGGEDKQCKLLIKSHDLGILTLSEVRDNPYAAIEAALKRVKPVLLRRASRKSKSRMVRVPSLAA